MNKFINGVQRGVLLLCMMHILCACGKQYVKETDPVEEPAHLEEPDRPNTAESQEEVSDLDSFYQNPVTQPYVDIRTLGENYNKEQAQMDGCFVIGAMVHNDIYYEEFMERYQNKEDAFIRVVQGMESIVIDDILYDSSADKIYLVHDSTRDNSAAETDKSITLYEFEDIAEYYNDNGNGRLYWIAFNCKISDIDFDSDEIFIITLIN